MSHSNAAPASSRSAWLWSGFVTAFLILQLVIGGAAFYLATGDPSVAVLPDYHTRALHWDDEVQRRRQSDALGWQFSVDWSRSPVASVTCVDPHGQPIDGGQGTVRYYHHARAGDVRDQPLAAGEAGQYQAELNLDRPGLWTVQWQLQRSDQEIFLLEQEIESFADGRVAANPDPNSTGQDSVVGEPAGQEAI